MSTSKACDDAAEVVNGTFHIFLDETEDSGFAAATFRRADLDFESLKEIARSVARNNPLPIPLAIVVTESGEFET